METTSSLLETRKAVVEDPVTPHPSLMSRAIRRIVAPIIIGGAAVVAAPSLPVEGQEVTKSDQKAEDPALQATRLEMQRLIRELDSERYRVREQAGKTLERMAVEWVTTKQAPFPLASLLMPSHKHSLEQQRRLTRIFGTHEREELGLLWRPVVFREPSEWKERKTPPRLSEVLSVLGKQAGRRITLARSVEDRAVEGSFDGKTFWQVLTALRGPAGCTYGPYVRPDGHVTLYPDAGDTYVVDGNTLGRLRRCFAHPCDPECRIDMEVIADVLPIADLQILTATGVTDKGRKVELLDERTVTGQWSPKSATVLTVAVEEGEERMDATVTVLFHGYETRVEAVRDCTKKMTFSVGPYELCLSAKHREAERGPPWSIGIRFSGEREEDAYDQQRLLNAIQCRAFDAKGAPVECVGPWDATWRFFAAEPHRLELVLPLRSTTMQKTFTFKGVPLH